MASEIMAKVLETEKNCEELVKKAKAEALEAAARADKQAEAILQNARIKAKELAEAKITEANGEAKKIIRESEEKSRREVEALREATRDSFDLASKAVASMLLKIS